MTDLGTKGARGITQEHPRIAGKGERKCPWHEQGPNQTSGRRTELSARSAVDDQQCRIDAREAPG
jgi:hypothetical protein